MFNKKKAERELLYSEINKLKKINLKLADENRRLHEGLDDIELYRQKYKELIESVEIMQKKYAKQVKSFKRLEVAYQTELEKIKNEK